MNDWPPSNYPIFLALVLLAATAVTLAMGDEPRAEELAIYAYYFLVIGVAIRFFEIALPENAVRKLAAAAMRLSDWMKLLASKTAVVTQMIAGWLKIPHVKILHIHPVKLDKNLVIIADVSKNVAIFLSLFFLISLLYGLMIDWWAVKGYISNLILVILVFLTFHVFVRGSAFKK